MSQASEEHMLNYLLSDSINRTLTEWEKGFVEDMSNLPKEKPLTPSQLAKLREIYKDH